MHNKSTRNTNNKTLPLTYSLSYLENDRDVSAYSGGKRLLSGAQLVCFLAHPKSIGIDAQRMHLAACILGVLKDVMVVLGMRQSIDLFLFISRLIPFYFITMHEIYSNRTHIDQFMFICRLIIFVLKLLSADCFFACLCFLICE